MQPSVSARRRGGRKPPSLFRSLCISMASILFSLVMLVGTTMAWFTDTKTSAVSTITAGNISAGNVQVLSPAAIQSEDSAAWQPLPTDSTSGTLFSNTPYTPGAVQTVCLKLQNDGDLPTRYRVSLQLKSESNDLSNLLQYGYQQFESEAELLAFAAKGKSELANPMTYAAADILSQHNPSAYTAQATTCVVDLQNKTDAAYLALSIFMPAGASTQDLPENQEVQVQLTLLATQLTADSDAPEAWDGVTATALEPDKDGVYQITSPADLAGAAVLLRNAEASDTYTLHLTTDINMNNQQWTPIDTRATVTLNGDGHTIYSLNAVGGENAGLFGTVPSLTVTSLTFAGGSASGGTAGMLAGHADTADLTAVCAQDITITAHTANPLVGSGIVTQSGCNVSNYSIQQP